jgi:hypothetical protein
MINSNGATYKNKNGYLCYKDTGKLVHRCVVDDYLVKNGNDKLYPEEVVHHIDGDILNNDIDNLEIFESQREHYKHHMEERRINEGYDDEDDDYEDDDYDDEED